MKNGIGSAYDTYDRTAFKKGDIIIVNGIDTPYVIGDEIQFNNVNHVIKAGFGFKAPDRDKIKKFKSMGDVPMQTGDTTIWRFGYGDGSIDDGEWLIKMWLDFKFGEKIIKQENTWTFIRLHNWVTV